MVDPKGTADVLRTLNGTASQLAYYRSKGDRSEISDDTTGVAGGGRLPVQSPSMERNARYQRTRRVCRELYWHMGDRPASDQAHIINELIETYCIREVRILLRGETYVERERYVGIREAIFTLRENDGHA